MIVSYGRNNFPGGNENTSPGFGTNTLMPGALYVDGDEYPPAADGTVADYTLKIIDKRFIKGPGRSAIDEATDTADMLEVELTNPDLLLSNDPEAVATLDATSQHFLVLRSLSLRAMDSGNFAPATGQVGVIDEGSDDIILEF
jgi:hypothetical protein